MCGIVSVHLIVEASDARALSSGVRSLAIRMARYVNQLVTRRGRFWADRWHGRVLTTPRAVRTALVYVLANFRKHSRAPLVAGVDAFSSSATFDGFRAAPGALPRAGPPVHEAMARWVVVAAPGDVARARGVATRRADRRGRGAAASPAERLRRVEPRARR